MITNRKVLYGLFLLAIMATQGCCDTDKDKVTCKEKFNMCFDQIVAGETKDMVKQVRKCRKAYKECMEKEKEEKELVELELPVQQNICQQNCMSLLKKCIVQCGPSTNCVKSCFNSFTFCQKAKKSCMPTCNNMLRRCMSKCQDDRNCVKGCTKLYRKCLKKRRKTTRKYCQDEFEHCETNCIDNDSCKFSCYQDLLACRKRVVEDCQECYYRCNPRGLGELTSSKDSSKPSTKSSRWMKCFRTEQRKLRNKLRRCPRLCKKCEPRWVKKQFPIFNKGNRKCRKQCYRLCKIIFERRKKRCQGNRRCIRRARNLYCRCLRWCWRQSKGNCRRAFSYCNSRCKRSKRVCRRQYRKCIRMCGRRPCRR